MSTFAHRLPRWRPRRGVLHIRPVGRSKTPSVVAVRLANAGAARVRRM